MADKLNSNGDVAERDEAGRAAEVAAEMMREVSGFFDKGRTDAYVSCCVDLAVASGLTLVECFSAYAGLLLATEMKLAERSLGLGAGDETGEPEQDATGEGAGR